MNFLAHLYLSGSDARIMTGNFLGDFVKGRKALESLDPGIVSGIELHRGIDNFTDHHPIVQQSKNRLRPKYRHYSGVIVDMFYDHFLGAGWDKYSPVTLSQFAQQAYHNLQTYESIMPQEARKILPYIITGNWLVGYSSTEGLHRALSGMASRSRYDSKMDEAQEDLTEYYGEFKQEFESFFPALQEFVGERLEGLKVGRL